MQKFFLFIVLCLFIAIPVFAKAPVNTTVIPPQVQMPPVPQTPEIPGTEQQIINFGQGIPIDQLSQQMGVPLVCQEDGYLHVQNESAPKIVLKGRTLQGKEDLALPVRCKDDKYYLNFLQ